MLCKRTQFLIFVVSTSAISLVGAQPLNIARPEMEIRSVTLQRERVEVEKVHIEPFTFEKNIVDDHREAFNQDTQQQNLKDAHLDFGSRELDLENRQNEFSNMKMVFEDPEYKHLDFNTENR